MKFKQKFFNAAYAVALAAPGVGGRNRHCFRLGCVIINKNRIVSAKANSYKTHPALTKFFKYPCGHAEARAIISLGIDTCLGKSLYVVRIQRNGELGLALPCSSCRCLIKEVGIANVYYSTYDGFQELTL